VGSAVVVAVEAGADMRIAAVDVGSNSIHMVVAQVEADGRFRVLDRAKEMVRLGRRTLNSGRLSPQAMDAGVRTLAAFRTLAERQGVTRITAVATSAVREAANGGDFIKKVEDDVGLRVKVIPGREEARLIYLGVRHAVDLSGKPTLIVDIGGGSVEFILIERGNPVSLDSHKIGVARLSERLFNSDPPESDEIDALEAHLANQLDPMLGEFRGRGVRRVIGTSGTLLNLVAIAGHLRGEPPDLHLNNFSVSSGEIAKVRRLLSRSSREDRLRVKGLDAKRADLIIAGAVLADYILTRVGAKQLVACTWALREGVLLDFIARHRKGIEESERYGAPRGRSVARLARHLGETSKHGSRVARLALRLFDQLESRLRIDHAGRELLEYAALLHDVGHHIDHQNHHRHSYYLITNGELLGFQRDELEIIGLVARYHRKSAPKASDTEFRALNAKARTTVRALSALLRVADALDRSHYGAVKDVTVSRRGTRLTLHLATSGDAQLELWEAQQRVGLLEDVLGLDVEFKAFNS
jgi:exopolyphosphatase/guanosine-5'-triphosphate,3'-diphosphate pyrophosphatase